MRLFSKIVFFLCIFLQFYILFSTDAQAQRIIFTKHSAFGDNEGDFEIEFYKADSSYLMHSNFRNGYPYAMAMYAAQQAALAKAKNRQDSLKIESEKVKIEFKNYIKELDSTKFSTVVYLCKKIKDEDINYATTYGTDGVTYTITIFENQSQKTYSIWCPEIDSKKRRLQDFNDAIGYARRLDQEK